MKRHVVALLFLLIVGAVYSAAGAPVGFGTQSGFGGQVVPPRELLGIRLGAGPPAAQTLNLSTYVQVPLGAVEYIDTNADFEVSSDGNLICNTSGNDLTTAEIHLSSSIANVDLQTWSLNVRFGICQGCILDTFPQLDATNDLEDIDMPVSFRNQVLFDDAVLITPISVIGDGGCLGLMMLGDATNDVRITGGTLSVFGSDSGVASQAQAQIQTLQAVETSRLFMTATFDGGGGSVEATDAEWRQLPLDLNQRTVKGSQLIISADGNLVCNTSIGTINGGFTAVINVSQSTAGNKTLLIRMGSRTGEGALVDGDEVEVVQVQTAFSGAGMSPNQVVIPGYGPVGSGVCIGIMVRSTTGIPLLSYTVEAGTVAITFQREIP